MTEKVTVCLRRVHGGECSLSEYFIGVNISVFTFIATSSYDTGHIYIILNPTKLRNVAIDEVDTIVLCSMSY